jgi:hypothetical protein
VDRLSYCKTGAKYEACNQQSPLQETTFLPDSLFICFEEFQTKRWLLSYTTTLTCDVAGGREKRASGKVAPGGRVQSSQRNILMKETDFMLNKYWIIETNKRKLNKNLWLFLNIIIYECFGGGHYDYSRRRPEDLVKPLTLLFYLHRAFQSQLGEHQMSQVHTARIYMAHLLPLVYYKVS